MTLTDLSLWRVAPVLNWIDAWAAWLQNDYIRCGGGELSPKSLAARRQDILHLSRYFERTYGSVFTPDQLTPDVVRRYFDDQVQCKARPNTRNRRLVSLRVLVKWCISQGILTSDPTLRQVRAREMRLPRRAMDAAQIDAVERVALGGLHLKSTTEHRAYLGERDRALWCVFKLTGLRIGSIAALDVDEIDLRDAFPVLRVVEKGSIELELPISPELAAALARWLPVRRAGTGQALFTDWRGNRITTSQIRRRLQAMALQAGIRLKPHDLRHTRAEAVMKDALQKGHPFEKAIAVAAALMGHRDHRTTLGYLRPTNAEIREVNDSADVHS